MAGTISTNTTWSAASSPYHVVATVTVGAQATLTIEPGVQVVVRQYQEIAVDGTLVATGSAGAPIVFDGSTQTSGWWAGLGVRNVGSAALDYVTIAHAGYWNGAGIYKTGTGNLTVRHSTLRDTAGAGLRLNEGYGVFTSENNTFSGNLHGVRLGINTSFRDTTSIFANNSAAQVVADGGTHTKNVSWELSPAYSIRLTDSHAVAAGATLTLQPGLVLKFAQYQELAVDGTLAARGTAAQPIRLTDYRDDTVGGDTNNDGAQTSPAAGWWTGLGVRNAGSAALDHVTIAHAGYWNGAGIYKTGTGDLTVRHSTLRDTASAGLRLNEGTGVFTSENNTFSGNVHGVRLGINTSFRDTTSTFANNSAAQVAADGGTHTKNVSWELSPAYSIFITGTQLVAAGATLTLQPGLVLKFAQYQELAVDGTLVATGTAPQPIRLTNYRDDTVGGDTNNDGAQSSPAAGWWTGLGVRNAGSAALAHVTIAHAGYWNGAGIYKTGTGDLTVRHSTLRDTASAGLRLNEGTGVFTSENNTFSGNVHGVRLGINTSFRDTTSTFANNSTAQVAADGGTHTKNVSWELSPAYSILITGTQLVAAGATLTLQPGLVLKFAQYQELAVDGTLVATGTGARPIRLTNYRDDTVGGDTNNDGAQSSPAAGWWTGLGVRNAGSALLTYATISYAGYWNHAGVLKLGSGSLTLADCAFLTVDGAGLLLQDFTGSAHVSRCRFAGNTVGARILNTSQAIVLEACEFEGNATHGVLNVNSGTIDARWNWWRDATGPKHPTLNPAGQGDVVSNGVLFAPWRSSPDMVGILAPLRSGTIVAGDSLRFTGSEANDPLAGYRWDFGDARTSLLRSPGVVAFPQTGGFEVVYSLVRDGAAVPFPETRVFTVVADTGGYPDLRLDTMQVPASAAIGQETTIAYSATNIGPGALASSTWKDRIYLSSDAHLDARDLLLAETQVSRALGPGEAYSGSIPITLPVIEEGARHVILSVNDDWQVLERRRLNNESASAINVAVPLLPLGQNFTGTYQAGRVEQYFRISATAGQSLVVDFSHSASGLEIRIRFGQLPTRGEYDHRLQSGRLVIPSAAAGDWYVLVSGDSLPIDGEFTLKPVLADVVLARSTPSIQDSSAPLELNLGGAGFAAPIAVDLLSAGGGAHPADGTTIESFTAVTATFAAGSLPVGTYAVRVTRDGSESTLPAALQIVSGGQPDFRVNITSPGFMGYHQLATLFVDYTNRGNAPMPAPLLVITALQNGRPGALMTLDQSRLAQGFWTSAIPKGYATSVRLVAGGAQPGVLLPGESRRVPVYYAGWLKPWDFAYPPFEFKVVALTADDDRPVPWSALQSALRPPGENDDSWAAVWANFTSGIGGTVGDFVSMLSRNAAYLAKLGADVRDVNTLLAFELTKARGLSGPLSELTATVDLHADLGSLNLIFARSFPRNITNRHRLGPMGYGWNHCWEILLEREADGTVAILPGNGARRVFQPDSRGSGYFAGRGDNARLIATASSATLTEVDGTAKMFNSSGRLASVRDRNGNTIDLTYAADRLARLAHSDGMAIDLTYHPSGRLAKAENSLGDFIAFTYDGNQHLITATDHRGRTIEYRYQTATDGRLRHALTGITHAGGRIESFAYDERGRLATHDNGVGSTSFAYSQGDVAATDPEGYTSTISFDHTGLIARLVDAAGGVTSIAHDASLNNTLIRSADGTAMQFAPDAHGGISSLTNQKGDTWDYATGTFGQVTHITTPTGRTTGMEYDARGNLIRRVLPDGSLESFAYDAKGRLVRTTNALGMTETTSYNPAGLLVGKVCSDGTTRTFEYGAKNRLTKATNAEGDTVLEYDLAGNLASVTYPNGLEVRYTYDAVGRRVGVNDTRGGVTRYVYNSAGLIERLTDGAGTALVRYAYDGRGRIREKHFSNGARTVYERNARGQITRQTTRDAQDQILADFAITYDSSGLPVSYQTPQGAFAYQFDPAGHLSGMDFVPVSGPTEVTRYERNADGVLVSMAVDGVETSFDSDPRGRFTAVGSAVMTYDAAGNVLTKSAGGETFSYHYDAIGRLVEMETGGDSYRMRYDALGTPLGLTSPDLTVNYLYDWLGGARLLGEYAANGDPVRTYRHGVDLAVVHHAGSAYQPEFDPLRGDTILALPTGSVALSARRTNLAVPAFYLPFDPPFDDDNPLLPGPNFFGTTLDGYMTLASGAVDLGGQAYSWAVDEGGIDTWVGGAMRDSTFSLGTGIIGLGGPLNELNDLAGSLTNAVVVITDAPEWMHSGVDFLTSDGLGNALNVLGVITGGIEVIDGISETWSENRSVDVLDVVNPFGGLDEGTTKIRHGMASTALTLLGMAAAGTAAAPVAAAAGIIAFISDNTAGLQEDFWIWWDGLDVTGETLRGSAFSGSLDPNQKLGIRGFGTANCISAQTRLTYRIDFENHPDATAPAQVVTMRDKLPDEVDWSTFELLEVGFGDISVPVDPGTREFETVVKYNYQDPDYDFAIEVHVSVAFEDGEIFAIFSSIDPATGLPPPVQIGFLPPEPEKSAGATPPGEGRGQGHISYAVTPRAGLPDGTEIRNVATIQFDFSLEIDTNQVDPLDASKGVDANKEALHTIDARSPTATIHSLPDQSGAAFAVSWSGDDTSGAGVAFCDVYVSDNGGAWTLWQRHTTAASAVFNGMPGHNYAFYVHATDALGLSEVLAPHMQAQTIAGASFLVNISNRGGVGTGANIMIPGFVIQGTGTKKVLVRGVGPTLEVFGVTGVLADPRMQVFSGSTEIAANDNWSEATNAAEVASVAAAVNAFALQSGTADAATLLELNPGGYTVHVSGVGSSTGVALVELYDADSAGTSTSRLVNISTRGEVGIGSAIMIPGFVVQGSVAKTVLVRGIGPTLAAFGVGNVLADPTLRVFGASGSLTTNDDWGDAPNLAELVAATAAVQAFALAPGSKDAAALLTLEPGLYTVHVSGVGNSTGVALVEIYEVND